MPSPLCALVPLSLVLTLLTGCGGYGQMQGAYLRGDDVSRTGSGDTYHGGALAVHVGALLPETLNTASPLGVGVSGRAHVWDSGLSIPEVGLHTFLAIEPAGSIGFYLQGGGYFGLAYFDGLGLDATAYGQVGVFYAVSESEGSARDDRDFFSLAFSDVRIRMAFAIFLYVKFVSMPTTTPS